MAETKITATYYSNKYAVALFEQYSALNTEEKKSKWVRETVERLSAAITVRATLNNVSRQLTLFLQHANKCQTWHKKYLEQLVMDEMAEVRKRKQRCVSYVATTCHEPILRNDVLSHVLFQSP